MVKLKSKLRILRGPFKKSRTPLERKQDEDETNMKSSPSQRSRRLLGSIVLGKKQSSFEKPGEQRDSSEDNKENNGSTDDSQSCSLSYQMPSKMDSGLVAVNQKPSSTDTKRAKDLKKIPMTCSELFIADSKNKSTTKSVTLTANNNLSPLSATSSTVVSRGRRCSDLMNYSSLADKNFMRIPSAKTISDQMYVPSSASSSENVTTKAETLPVMQQPADAAMGGRDDSVSPNTKQILAEVESAYMSSPIPSSYLSSPKNETSALPHITIDRSKKHDRRSSAGTSTNPTARKNLTNASTLLDAHQNEKDETSKQKTLESRLATNNATNNNGRKNRESFSAPNESTTKRSLTRKVSSQSLSDGRSTSRSPVNVASRASSSSSKPSALAVKREKEQRKQRIKDDQNNKGTDGRQNLDKRTARLRYGNAFKSDILQHRANATHLNNGSNHSDKAGSAIQDRSLNGVSVAVRKRPIFDYELDRGDYDIVSIDNTTESSSDIIIIHNCVMHPDMKQMLMKPTRYPATAAFDEHCSDDDIYKHLAEPLVQNAASGSVSTILMYGQTGCGKSHTMSGIEARTANGIFHALQGSSESVTIQFVELCGSKECKDLLSPSLSEVKIRDNEDGSVQLANATALEISNPDDLVKAIQQAKGRRATEATDKNGVSSRSHAVCQLRIKGKGVLTLIDCAGSERRHDSMYHDSQRQKESAEINASLWTLKECLRARANKSSRIPYRSSTLTRILRESLEREDACLCVIGCVAPNASDTEHTMETLKTISTIVGIDGDIVEEKARPVSRSDAQVKSIKAPKQWSYEELKSFLDRKNMDGIKLAPDKHDGAVLMKMSVSQMRAHLFDDRNKDMAEKLFNLLRTENDRVSKLQRKERMRVANNRKGKL